MGTIKQGILGPFSGKVGTVVGGTWKGINYMRSIAQNIKNPRTEGQQTQRSKFSLSLALLKPLTAYIRTGFKAYANKQTAFNSAMSYILKNAISGAYPDFSLDFEKVLVSRGNLAQAANASATAKTGYVEIHWTYNGEGSATDFAMPLAFNKDNGEAVFSTCAATRSAQTLNLNTPDEWAGSKIVVYLGMISADGTNVANSLYFGEFTAM